MLSYSASRGVPPNASNAASWQASKLSNRSSATNSAYAARLWPNTATNTDNGSDPRRITAQSTCICRPGSVSKRRTGSGATAGRNAARCSRRMVMPPS